MNKPSFPSLRLDGRTLILGLGETGLAAARWCAAHGAAIRVADTRAHPAGLDGLRESVGEASVDYRLGEGALAAATLDGVHTLVLSPGLSPAEPQVKDFLDQAKQRGIEVIGEIELFARALRDLREQGYTPRLAAVTGTNGKTTVTAMLAHMARACGQTASAAGNISPAALAALADALASNALPDVWVLELSSFQLEAIHSLEADAGVVLNLTQDHLDWHGSMQAYGAAKARLLRMSRVAVVNREDAAVLAMVEDTGAADVRSFGRDLPELEGDMGLESSGGVAWLAAAEAADFDLPAGKPRRGKAAEAPGRAKGRVSRLMPVDALRLRGGHNALNALAALAVGRVLGLGWAGMLRALRDYGGEPHRCEFVRNVAGVDFINDSKGTNVGATVAALEGMGRGTVLIAGGLGKGQDFSPLAKAVRSHAKAAVLIGQDAGTIAESLRDTGVPLERAGSLPEAVGRAFALAGEGDAVLLSPACASMDMFRNYSHRGASFMQAVQDLAQDNGEVA